MTENSNKRDRTRTWVRSELEYSLVTVHSDWYQDDRGGWCIADDNASRVVPGTIERHRSSSAENVEVLADARQAYMPNSDDLILEVIIDRGSKFINPHQEERPCPDHDFEGYLDENDIKHTLCKVGRSHSNGKLERFYQICEKHRWQFDALAAFLRYCNELRPHVGLEWGNLARPKEAVDSLLPQPEIDIGDPCGTTVTDDD